MSPAPYSRGIRALNFGLIPPAAIAWAAVHWIIVAFVALQAGPWPAAGVLAGGVAAAAFAVHVDRQLRRAA